MFGVSKIVIKIPLIQTQTQYQKFSSKNILLSLVQQILKILHHITGWTLVWR